MSFHEGKIPSEATNFAQNISKDIQFFNNRFINQFNIQIPQGILKPIDHYRRQKFPYLHDSEYRDNICYLLQCADYQVWQYQLFKPGLSLENSIFYQLLITFGIITEALGIAILLNPVMIKKAESTDHGVNLTQIISNNPFKKNIQLLKNLGQIDESCEIHFNEIRTQLRNLVHLQHWPGKLFRTLTMKEFNTRFRSFNHLLDKLLKLNPGSHSLDSLIDFFALSGDKRRQGQIQRLVSNKSYGFIRDSINQVDYFFRYKNIEKKESTLSKGQKVTYQIFHSDKGVEARDISFDANL